MLGKMGLRQEMQSHVRRITTAVGAAALAFTWGCSTGSEQSERGTDLQSERTAEPSPKERAGSHNWRTVTTEYYRLHSASGFEDDAKKAQGYLNAAVKGLLDEFGPTPLQSLLRDASVHIYLHPRPTPKASESTATIVSGVRNDRYFAKVHILTPSAYGSGSRTNVGEPRDDSYFFKTLVHEYSTVALERLRRSEPGWSFFSAPRWFYQGYEEYLALTRSSEKARTVTLQKYKKKLKQNPNRVRKMLCELETWFERVEAERHSIDEPLHSTF